MPAQTCWKCIARLSLQPPLRPLPPVRQPTLPAAPTSANAFSTSSPSLAAGNVRDVAKRGRPALRLSKKKRVKSYKRPEPGERKALRQRIVLSNTNAQEVQGLVQYSPETVSQEENVGKFLALSNDSVDGLRACEAFKTSQRWAYFSRPCVLSRRNTFELSKLLSECNDAEKKQTLRRMIVGEKGAGKSVLLLQAQAWALAKGWVVISFPDARNITNATTAYSPLPSSNPPLYSQKDYTATLLARILKTNRAVLSTLPVLQQHPELPPEFRRIDTLANLCQRGSEEADASWPAFQAFWSELNMQISETDTRHRQRPPIMMTLDGLAWVSRLSSYLASSMHYIHAHDLALVKHFHEHFSGATALPNGGAVLASDSGTNRPKTPALDLAIKQSDERVAEIASLEEGGTLPEQPMSDPAQPWERVDERGLVAVRGVPTMRVEKLSKEEARTLLEYYARSGMLRRRVTDTLVGEAWTLSGGGNVSELERASVGGGFM